MPVAAAPPAGVMPFAAVEKLACEWEARHDVAARGRQVDPAAALRRYLSRARLEAGEHHGGQRPPQRSARHARRRDQFTALHPLAATWLRWGEEPR